MRFKSGDLVIKVTGGNKMKVIKYDVDNKVECVWVTDIVYEGIFYECDLVSIDEYKKSILVIEQRDISIKEILDE